MLYSHARLIRDDIERAHYGGGNRNPTFAGGSVWQTGADPRHAFPGHGQVKPEQQEIGHLLREVAKLKAERDILKKAAADFARDAT